VKTAKSGLDAAFVHNQRQRLLDLRAKLAAAVEATEADEEDVKGQRGGAGEREDDAQALDALERDDSLVAHDAKRLERVVRALEKIQEGTYGLSDISGQPIPRARLEAIPEAWSTLSEERSSEEGR
jgi:DnaK suppressor protein